MDIIMNMLSLAKDVNSTEKQLKKLNFQIKYELQKAKKLAKNLDKVQEHDSFIVENFLMRINEAEKYVNKFDELLNQEKLGIKEKIIFNLPFDQTKKQANIVLQDLKKAISDVKDLQNQENQNEGGIKRRIKDDNSLSSPLNSQNQQMDGHKKSQELSQIFEMGPTIKQDEIVLSQACKQKIVQFTISIQGQQNIISYLSQNAPDMLKTRERINLAEKIDEKVLYLVARSKFKKIYQGVKSLSRQIDGISTNGHFRFILKKLDEEHTPSTGHKNRLSQSQQPSTIKRSTSKEKNQQQQFFSFPEQNLDFYNSFKVMIRKEDSKKNVYIHREQQWQKIQQEQFQIVNGDKIAAYYNQKTEDPSIFYSITYYMVDK